MNYPENLKSQNVAANWGGTCTLPKTSTDELNFIIGKIKYTVKRIRKSGAKIESEADEL